MGLTTGTISYHINALIREGMLKTSVQSGKIFYQLDKKQICQQLDELKQYIQTLS